MTSGEARRLLPELTPDETRRLMSELTAAVLTDGTVIGAVRHSGILAGRCDCAAGHGSAGLGRHAEHCSAAKWYRTWRFSGAAGRQSPADFMMHALSECRRTRRTRPCPD